MPGRDLDTDLRERAAQIFGDALERPAEERAAFVEQACAGSPALQAEVQ